MLATRDRAIKLESDDTVLHCVKAFAFYRLGRYEEVLVTINKVIALVDISKRQYDDNTDHYELKKKYLAL